MFEMIKLMQESDVRVGSWYTFAGGDIYRDGKEYLYYVTAINTSLADCVDYWPHPYGMREELSDVGQVVRARCTTDGGKTFSSLSFPMGKFLNGWKPVHSPIGGVEPKCYQPVNMWHMPMQPFFASAAVMLILFMVLGN